MTAPSGIVAPRRSGLLSRRTFLAAGGTAVALGGLALAGRTPAFAASAPTVSYYDPTRLGPRQRLQADVCVYGATAGGVIAAVQAASAGQRTVLLAFGENLGGLTTSGISATDTGYAPSIGGLAQHFYQQIGLAYGSTAAVYDFEPHVAAAVISAMLRQAGVIVLLRQPLATVTKQGGAITELVTEAGTNVRALQYIDASYEGDLLARTGVEFRVGREAARTYDEDLNGFHPTPSGSGFRTRVDPYQTPGRPDSGLLSGIQPPSGAVAGSADDQTMAYGFRLCITEEAGAIPFPKPSGYRATDWELALRTIQGGEWDLLDFRVALPGQKYDLNAQGGISTDAIGMSDTWAEADYPARERLFQDHVRYDQGLLWFAGHDPRLPAAIRADTSRFGLAADEFTATGGWPPELYVREARRLVSDYVTTEWDCLGGRHAPDPVALASYKIDGHACRRSVVGDLATDEGALDHAVAHPYGLSLRSLLPRREECTNLAVSTCVASSHVAWSSLRMEPVFMMLGQAAAVVSSLAIDQSGAVQDVPYAAVRAALLATGAVLDSGAAIDSGASAPLTATTRQEWNHANS
jgi:hypothetical protein